MLGMTTASHSLARAFRRVGGLRSLLTLFMCWWALPAYADRELPPASIGVSPSRIELEVGSRSVTESVTVMNLAKHPVTIEVSLANWDLDDASEFRELPPDDGTLPSAIMVNPVQFTIPEGTSQTVRFAVRPERLNGDGEHRAMLFFSEYVNTMDPGVRIRFRMGVPIYARVGKLDESLELHSWRLDAAEGAARFDMDISALGNVNVRPKGFYVWWPETDYPGDRKALTMAKRLAKNTARLPDNATGGVLSAKPVLPGARRTVQAAIRAPQDPGKYRLAAYFQAGDGTYSEVFPLNIP